MPVAAAARRPAGPNESGGSTHQPSSGAAGSAQPNHLQMPRDEGSGGAQYALCVCAHREDVVGGSGGQAQLHMSMHQEDTG